MAYLSEHAEAVEMDRNDGSSDSLDQCSEYLSRDKKKILVRDHVSQSADRCIVVTVTSIVRRYNNFSIVVREVKFLFN